MAELQRHQRTNITGATASTYVVAEGDEGQRVTTLDGTGVGATGYSGATALVLDASPVVTISGKAQVGQTLSATVTLSDADDSVSGYQWQSYNGTSWSNITGATASAYVVAQGDQALRLRVVVTTLDNTAVGATAYSGATAPVVNASVVVPPTQDAGSTTLGTENDQLPSRDCESAANDPSGTATLAVTGLERIELSPIAGGSYTVDSSPTDNLAVLKSTDEVEAGPSGTPIMVATAVKPEFNKQRELALVIGPTPNPRDLAEALFLTGLATPIPAIERKGAGRSIGRATAPRRHIVTFDLADDKFDEPPRLDPHDLPPVLRTDGEGVE